MAARGPPPGVAQRAQLGCEVTVAPVLTERGHERLRVVLLLLRLRLLGVAREQGARLQEQQPCTDRDELGEAGDVDAIRRAQVGEVLLGDLEQGDRRDIEFAALDQVQQQVQRSLEGGKPQGEAGRVGAGGGPRSARATRFLLPACPHTGSPLTG